MLTRKWIINKPHPDSKPLFCEVSLYSKSGLIASRRMVYDCGDTDEYLIRKLAGKQKVKPELVEVRLLIEWLPDGGCVNHEE